MAAVIIRKKDLDKLGKEVLKELYKFLHDDYILNTFPDMEEEKKKNLKNLVIGKFENVNYTIVQKENSWSIEHEEFDESKFDDELKCVKKQIKNGSLDTNLIFKTLNSLNLDMEIDEDLYFKTLAFINIFKVFDSDYSYLED